MCVEAGAGGEALVADVADVRLLPGVRPHVDLEAVFVHVAVAADVTLELGADVRLEVPRQPGRARC